MVVDITLKRSDVDGVALDLSAQVLDSGRIIRIHSGRFDARNHLEELLFEFRLVGGPVLAERRLHLRKQILLQELGHIGALGVHHSVEAKVQVGLIELKQLLQQCLQFLVPFVHPMRFFS